MSSAVNSPTGRAFPRHSVTVGDDGETGVASTDGYTGSRGVVVGARGVVVGARGVVIVAGDVVVVAGGMTTARCTSAPSVTASNSAILCCSLSISVSLAVTVSSNTAN